MSVLQAPAAITALESRDLGARATDILVTGLDLDSPTLVLPTESGLVHYWPLGGPSQHPMGSLARRRSAATKRQYPTQEVDFCLDGLQLRASVTEDNAVSIVEEASNDPLQDPFTGHTDTITDIVVFLTTHNQTRIATASADGTVRLWDPESGQPWGPPLIGHDGAVSRVIAITPSLLATAGEDRTVKLWDLSQCPS